MNFECVDVFESREINKNHLGNGVWGNLKLIIYQKLIFDAQQNDEKNFQNFENLR